MIFWAAPPSPKGVVADASELDGKQSSEEGGVRQPLASNEGNATGAHRARSCV
jgi:hypothetical protein